MSKEKTTPVKEEKLITLTPEQFAKLIGIYSTLDNVSDTLDGIDGDDNLFEIGKQVGDACSDIVNAYNDLGNIIEAKQMESIDWDFEDEDEN